MSGVFLKYKQEALKATYNLNSDTIKAVLVRLGSITSAGFKAVSGCTAATPGVVTVTSHGWSNGDIVTLSGIGGITGATGRFKIAGVATNTFQLTDPISGANVTTTGTYTSGGFAVNLSTPQFFDAVDSGARVATSSALGSKTFTLGVFSFAAFTWSAVATGAAAQAVIFYDDTPSGDSAKPLIAIDDGATNLPVTPNGGDITYTPNASGLFQL